MSPHLVHDHPDWPEEPDCSICAKCGHVQAEPNWCHKCGHRVKKPAWAIALDDRIAELEAEIEKRKWVAPAEMNAKNKRIEQLEAALREIADAGAGADYGVYHIARAALDSRDTP